MILNIKWARYASLAFELIRLVWARHHRFDIYSSAQNRWKFQGGR